MHRFVAPGCLLLSALLPVAMWRWWDWSRSIDLRLSTDFPYSYCVDMVSGDMLDVSPEGDLRLRLDPHDQTARIDIVGPAGLYRAKIYTYSGYFSFYPQLPFAAETIDGPGTFSIAGFYELYVQGAVPGACAVTGDVREVSEDSLVVTPGPSVIYWVSSNGGRADAGGVDMIVQGAEGWRILVSDFRPKQNVIRAAADQVASLIVIDAEGRELHAVRDGAYLELVAPTSGRWMVKAVSVDGEKLSLAADCAGGESLWMNRGVHLTPP